MKFSAKRTLSTMAMLSAAACGSDVLQFDEPDDTPGTGGNAGSLGDGDGDGDSGDTAGTAGVSFMEQIRLFEGGCLPVELPRRADNSIPCAVIEAVASDFDCAANGRTSPHPGAAAEVLVQLEASGHCGGASGLACSEYSLCELPFLEGAEAEPCQTDLGDTTSFAAVGVCYIDDPESALVADCSTEERRQLRASGANVPVKDAVLFLGCTGSAGPSTSSSENVGEACAGAEQSSNFSGHSQDWVGVYQDSATCGGGHCLAQNTQGRVGCAYGQSQQDLELPDDDPARCRTPDGELVTVEVAPQLVSRRADEFVYCSCRCDGPNSGEDYCECPNGFVCEPLVPDLGLGSDIVGSYCVQEGSLYDSTDPETRVCDRLEANCE